MNARLTKKTAHLVIGSMVIAFSQIVAAGQCRLPEGDLKYVPDNIRDACVREARLLLKQPEVTREAILRGPTQPELPDDDWGGFDSSAELRCRYKYEDTGSGQSPKFYCYRTNEQGEFFRNKRNEEGQTEAGAVQVNAAGQLQDVAGTVLTTRSGKPKKADELKFKYFHNQPVRLANGQTEQGVPEREREVFTETAVTRFFWALGIPADRNYTVNAVTCDGCTADPFQTQTAIARRDARNPSTQQGNLVASRFETVAVERKFPGKRIEPQRGVQPGRDKVGFSFREIAARNTRPEQRLEVEVLLLAAAVVAYHNDLSKQNKVACPDQIIGENGEVISGYNEETGECFHPVAMIQDVGSTFGKAGGFLAKNPRGDFAAYNEWRVWSDKRNCRLSFAFGPHRQVSEAARRVFVERIQRVKPFISDIVRAARFHVMDNAHRNQVRQQQRLEGAALDEALIQAWTAKIESNIAEIETATCR